MILGILVASLVVIVVYGRKLRHSLGSAPQIESKEDFGEELPLVSAIIPAYNEGDNIKGCAIALLDSTPLSSLEVWVVDDQSTDDTRSIAQSLVDRDSRLQVLAGESRPVGEIWLGKNWACTQGVKQAKGEFLLFLDADVKLQPGAIEKALQEALRLKTDLLTIAPCITCECFPEWLIQPIMFNHLAVCFDFAAVNDPKSDAAFAAGPFMLFRHSSYELLGGHAAVKGEVVEDVELARRVKASGMKLGYAMGTNLASVRMYRSWGAIWEGWTKNLYLGANRSWVMMVYMAFIMLLIYPIPWLGLGVIIYRAFTGWKLLDYFSLGIILIALWQQYEFRKLSFKVSGMPLKYWWLGSVGGIIVGAIALASFIKTETGWGWTWRGRSLMQTNSR